MTCIVSFASKKALREALKSGNENFWITDPSIFNPRTFRPGEMSLGEKVVVTNHPKRSWFAEIRRTEKGYKVS